MKLTDDDLIWCPECGRMLPWKHKSNPTLRARIANTTVRLLTQIGEHVERWRDQDATSIVKASATGGEHLR